MLIIQLTSPICVLNDTTTTVSLGETICKNCGLTSNSSKIGSISIIVAQASSKLIIAFSNICDMMVVSISVKSSALTSLFPLPPKRRSIMVYAILGLTSISILPSRGSTLYTFKIVILGIERINSSYGIWSTDATDIFTYVRN